MVGDIFLTVGKHERAQGKRTSRKQKPPSLAPRGYKKLCCRRHVVNHCSFQSASPRLAHENLERCGLHLQKPPCGLARVRTTLHLTYACTRWTVVNACTELDEASVVDHNESGECRKCTCMLVRWQNYHCGRLSHPDAGTGKGNRNA